MIGAQDGDGRRDAYMARRWLAPPPLSLAAEWSPSPLLRNGEVLEWPVATYRRCSNYVAGVSARSA
jgi:hypothetical protein